MTNYNINSSEIFTEKSKYAQLNMILKHYFYGPDKILQILFSLQ